MKERTLQMLRYLTIPCLFSSLSLVADEQEGGSTNKAGAMTFSQTYDMVKTKEITPHAGAAVDGGVDVYLDASYIYWHASQGGLEYALNGIMSPVTSTGTAVLPTTDFIQPEGRDIRPNFKTHSGFKVGIGLDFSYDGWDLGLNYTWLHTHAKSSVGAGSLDGVLLASHDEGFIVQAALPEIALGQLANGSPSTSAIGLFFPSLQSASSSWRLHFNVLDLELGRDFFISSKLLLRPNFGFKGTWQKQNNITGYVADGYYTTQDATFSSNTATSTAVPQNRRVTGPPTSAVVTIEQVEELYEIVARQYFWGFGPRAGLDFSWLVSRNFSFFTDVAVSVLWGQFTNHRRDYIYIEDIATEAVVADNFSPSGIRSRTHQLSAVVEAQMGLRYDYWFSNDEYRFRSEIGWENQLWFNQNRMSYLDNYGDLSLQGLTLTFQFDF